MRCGLMLKKGGMPELINQIKVPEKSMIFSDEGLPKTLNVFRREIKN